MIESTPFYDQNFNHSLFTIMHITGVTIPYLSKIRLDIFSSYILYDQEIIIR